MYLSGVQTEIVNMSIWRAFYSLYTCCLHRAIVNDEVINDENQQQSEYKFNLFNIPFDDHVRSKTSNLYHSLCKIKKSLPSLTLSPQLFSPHLYGTLLAQIFGDQRPKALIPAFLLLETVHSSRAGREIGILAEVTSSVPVWTLHRGHALVLTAVASCVALVTS